MTARRLVAALVTLAARLASSAGMARRASAPPVAPHGSRTGAWLLGSLAGAALGFALSSSVVTVLR
jgi:hypothetical protein